MSTSISKLFEQSNSGDRISEKTIDDIDSKDYNRIIVDMSESEELRLQILDKMSEESPDDTYEIIARLGMMYQLSGVSSLRQFLLSICKNKNAVPVVRINSAKHIRTHNNKDEQGYECLDLVYNDVQSKINTTEKVEIIMLLSDNKKYHQKCREYLSTIVNDNSISSDYRYRILLSLEHHDFRDYFVGQLFPEFFKNRANPVTHRILAGQFLLHQKYISDDIHRDVCKELLNIAKDSTNDENIRADAADVLLQQPREFYCNAAREIIIELGQNGRRARTLFDNSQNVHVTEIEQSVLESLEKLRDQPIPPNLNFNQIEREILSMVKQEKKKQKNSDRKYEREERIILALNRIYADRAIYGKYNDSLQRVLIMVWSYIQDQTENNAEMLNRLLQELEEMSGTCSSGFISRLINAISGFGDFNIRISWRDQIVGNLSGRLSAEIRKIDNIPLQELILEEMVSEPSNYEQRKNFLDFFRQKVLFIREEMAAEFKDHISEDQFEDYFRKAISVYEMGE